MINSLLNRNCDMKFAIFSPTRFTGEKEKFSRQNSLESIYFFLVELLKYGDNTEKSNPKASFYFFCKKDKFDQKETSFFPIGNRHPRTPK